MQIAPAGPNSLFVIVSGVVQSPQTYSTVGNQLTFSQAPPSGTGNIICRYLALPASNVTTTAYRAYNEFTATSGQTTFSVSSYTPGFIDVYRNGVKLNNSSFTATSGTTVVLGTAANSGDSIVVISFFVSGVLNAIPNVSNSVGVNNYDASGQGGSGALQLPSGTTGQRPGSPSVGMQRWNCSLGVSEVYIGGSTGWQSVTSGSYNIDFMLVGGGGSGGQGSGNYGGGGGAGGLVWVQNQGVSVGTSYTITVGTGGAQQTSNVIGNNGNNSGISGSAFGYTALGGGGGGTQNVTAGANGGSGGGGGYAYAGGTGLQPSNASVYGGPYQIGFGNTGGTGNQSPNGGGGGGGAGAVGFTNTPCNGGQGLNMSFYFGTTYGASGWFAGGGGGSNQAGYPTPAGGQGGGGTGTIYNQSTQTAGTDGTGGGGGAGGSTNPIGKKGGDGIVMIRYVGTQRATGGNAIYSYSGYTVHVFTSSGTFVA
jgi:hypothetical protein